MANTDSTSLTEANKRSVFASSVILAAANLLPLIAVLKLNWKVYDLLVLYWIEVVVIGIFNVLRMILIAPRAATAQVHFLKLAFVPFFAGHFGLFCIGLGLALQFLFGKENFTVSDQVSSMIHGSAAMLFFPLFISHLFSFFWNYVSQREFRNATIARRMIFPYWRVLPVAAAFFASGWACQSLESPLWALAAMVLFKTIVDLATHIILHVRAMLRT